MNKLGEAFSTLAAKAPPAPPEVGALTYSERRLFDKAVGIYTSPPGEPELRAAFHCSTAVAAKIQTALVACFVPKKRRGRDNKTIAADAASVAERQNKISNKLRALETGEHFVIQASERKKTVNTANRLGVPIRTETLEDQTMLKVYKA